MENLSGSLSAMYNSFVEIAVKKSWGLVGGVRAQIAERPIPDIAAS